jgi:hypothetical protein
MSEFFGGGLVFFVEDAERVEDGEERNAYVGKDSTPQRSKAQRSGYHNNNFDGYSKENILVDNASSGTANDDGCGKF